MNESRLWARTTAELDGEVHIAALGRQLLYIVCMIHTPYVEMIILVMLTVPTLPSSSFSLRIAQPDFSG